MELPFRYRLLFLSLALAAASAALPAPAAPASPSFRFNFIALDHGDALLVRTPARGTWLIGAGAAGDAPRLRQYLKSQGVTVLDRLVAQNWLERHIGGMPEIISRWNVKQLYVNPIRASSPSAEALVGAAEKRDGGSGYFWGSPSAGESQPLMYSPYSEVNTLAPTPLMTRRFARDPACSLLLELRLLNVSMLTLGDSSRTHQAAFWREVNAHPVGQILRIGRSGAADALLESMLKPLKTQIAVIPVPRKSRTQPAPSLLSALRRARVRVYRTDRDGTIVVTTDGNNVRVTRGG
jgi:competence protein ComEC